MTARHPGLTCARFLYMQAEVREISGISLAQSRNASPVHNCCASHEYAKLELVEMPIAARATIRAAAIWLVRFRVIFSPGCAARLPRVWALCSAWTAAFLRHAMIFAGFVRSIFY